MSHTVTVSDVIKSIWNSSEYQIKDVNSSISTITTASNFVHPQLKEIQKNEKTPFLIISAPGAVGKTTFAKFAAFTKKGYYWDLSKIRLGDNSFIGTLAKTFGHENIGKILNELRTGEISFFIDAFDEAEISSGFQGVITFLNDIFDVCKNAPHPNIILFSRTETTENIRLVLLDMGLESFSSLYEIDYFDKINSIKFIKAYLKNANDTNHEKHPEPFTKAVEAIISKICISLNSNYDLAWEDREVLSFVGYAPVLQTIAEYLYEENYENQANNLESIEDIASGLTIISDFMKELLVREQGKVIKGVKQKVKNTPANWDDWSNIYTWNNQLVIILFHVLKSKNEWISYVRTIAPEWLYHDLIESIDEFLPNHPFLRGKEFTGPAFRDYLVGNLICQPNYQEQCESLALDSNIGFTPLFAYFYKNASKSCCFGNHAGMIYESAAAKLGFQDNLLLTFIRPNGDHHILEILNPNSSKDQSLEFECIIDEKHPLTFYRRLYHANIHISGDLSLGRRDGSMELCDAEIKCNNIIIKSKDITFNCYNEESTKIIAVELDQYDYKLRILKVGNGSVKVFWKNAELYPWSNYYIHENNEIQEEFQNEIYALKRIFAPFRKHGKGEFGKFAPFIDNRIVGSDELRKKLLNYLIKKGLISKDSSKNQYIISNNQLLNWNEIKASEFPTNSTIHRFIEEFRKDEL